MRATAANISLRQGVVVKISPRRSDLLCCSSPEGLRWPQLELERRRLPRVSAQAGTCSHPALARLRGREIDRPCWNERKGSCPLRLFILISVAIAAALTLAACGRDGPPLPPPGPEVQPAPTAQAAPPALMPGSTAGGPVASGPAGQETATKNGFDLLGNPVAPPGQKKSFLLDPLLQ